MISPFVFYRCRQCDYLFPTAMKFRIKCHRCGAKAGRASRIKIGFNPRLLIG